MRFLAEVFADSLYEIRPRVNLKYFETKINVPRIRHGKHQTLETLINEEAYLLAKFLGNEKPIGTHE